MENKIKLNTGLASIILVASIFAGWQTVLLVTILMFVFCDIDERVKQVATSVITFFVGYTIVSVGWDIVISIIDLVVKTFNSFIAYLVTNFEAEIEIAAVTGLINIVVNVLEQGVPIILSLAKIGFVIGVLCGRPAKNNVFSAKINEYVNKAINFVNGNVAGPAQQAPQPPQPPMPPSGPAQQGPVQPM